MKGMKDMKDIFPHTPVNAFGVPVESSQVRKWKGFYSPDRLAGDPKIFSH